MLEICRPPYSPIRLLFNISPCLTSLFYLFPASHSLLAKKEEKKDRKKQEIEITLHSKQINNAYTIYCSIYTLFHKIFGTSKNHSSTRTINHKSLLTGTIIGCMQEHYSNRKMVRLEQFISAENDVHKAFPSSA
jgi:hypothetical protein